MVVIEEYSPGLNILVESQDDPLVESLLFCCQFPNPDDEYVTLSGFSKFS